jgi:type VI secretion system protein ImpM
MFGKLPSAGDFLRLNVSPSVADALDAWLNASFLALEAEDPLWRESFPRAPVWRFSIDAGVAGSLPLAGVLQPSRDRVGRLFPCMGIAAMSSITAAAADAAARWFDRMETALGLAVADELSAEDLAQRLEELGPPDESDLDQVVVRGRSTPDGLFVDVPQGPDARAATLQAVLATTPAPEGGSLWWRHDKGAASVLITAGLPAANAFAALFYAPDLETKAEIAHAPADPLQAGRS